MCDRNINWFPLSHAPSWDQPATQACVLTGSQTGDFWLCRMTRNKLSHSGQGSFCFYFPPGSDWSPSFLSSVTGSRDGLRPLPLSLDGISKSHQVGSCFSTSPGQAMFSHLLSSWTAVGDLVLLGEQEKAKM